MMEQQYMFLCHNVWLWLLLEFEGLSCSWDEISEILVNVFLSFQMSLHVGTILAESFRSEIVECWACSFFFLSWQVVGKNWNCNGDLDRIHIQIEVHRWLYYTNYTYIHIYIYAYIIYIISFAYLHIIYYTSIWLVPIKHHIFHVCFFSNKALNTTKARLSLRSWKLLRGHWPLGFSKSDKLANHLWKLLKLHGIHSETDQNAPETMLRIPFALRLMVFEPYDSILQSTQT